MDGNGLNTSFSVIVMVMITLVLLTINIIEMLNLITSWTKAMSGNILYFNQCLKYPLILKTFFTVFSALSTISILFITLGFLINAMYFLRKIWKSFLHYTLFLFGPLLTIFCIIVFCNFDNFVYSCQVRLKIEYVFNFSHAFSVILCFIIGIVVWIAHSLYETLVIYSNSLTRHEEGSTLLRKAFYWMVMKYRPSLNNSSSEIRDNNNNNNNIPNQQSDLQINGNDETFNTSSNPINNNRNDNLINLNDNNHNRIMNNTLNNNDIITELNVQDRQMEYEHVSRENYSIIEENKEKKNDDPNEIKIKNLEFLEKLKNKNNASQQRSNISGNYIKLEEEHENEKNFNEDSILSLNNINPVKYGNKEITTNK